MHQSKASVAAAHTIARAIPRKCCFPDAAPAADPAGRRESDSRRVRVRNAVRAIRTACKTIPKNAAPRVHRNASPAPHLHARRIAPLEQRHWPRARCPTLFGSVSNDNSETPKTAALLQSGCCRKGSFPRGVRISSRSFGHKIFSNNKNINKNRLYSYVVQCDKTGSRSVHSDKVYTEPYQTSQCASPFSGITCDGSRNLALRPCCWAAQACLLTRKPTKKRGARPLNI